MISKTCCLKVSFINVKLFFFLEIFVVSGASEASVDCFQSRERFQKFPFFEGVDSKIYNFWRRGSLEKWKEKPPVNFSHDCSIVWALLKIFWEKFLKSECGKRVEKWKNIKTCATKKVEKKFPTLYFFDKSRLVTTN